MTLPPILLPEVHQKATIEHYIPFLDFVSNMSDLILYGGRPRGRTASPIKKREDFRFPPSAAIKFGSDISPPRGYCAG